MAALALHSLAAYGAYVWVTTSRSNKAEPVPVKALDQQEDSSHVFDEIAQHYDRDIRTSEFFMGLPLLRWSMAKRARVGFPNWQPVWMATDGLRGNCQGDVLEASAGTGRNTKYYPLRGGGGARRVESVTFVDSSGPMLEVARRAFQQRYPGYKAAHFAVRDAAAPGLRAPSGGKFDTVLQSMGLCSHRSPVQLLCALGEACKADGTIVLLEHGRSHYGWLNRILDRTADGHAQAWGCWWNRDVEAIVRASGLRIVALKRYHLGTTYWIEAKPPLRRGGEVADEGVAKDGGAGEPGRTL